MRNIIAAAALVAALSGCAAIDAMNARSDMEKSKAAYQACLADNPEMLSRCEGKRLAYEADMNHYSISSTNAAVSAAASRQAVVQQQQQMLQPSNLTCSQTGMFTNCHAW